MRLSDLPRRRNARVRVIEPAGPRDAIAVRLAELGFVAGERVRLLARGPFGGTPLLVQIGCTRFALRAAEAARILVEPLHDGC